jgi:hypothetical protein
MTSEDRYSQLQRLARGKDGMLQLQSLRQRLCGQTPVRNDDSLDRLIKEILEAEFPPSGRQVDNEVDIIQTRSS